MDDEVNERITFLEKELTRLRQAEEDRRRAVAPPKPTPPPWAGPQHGNTGSNYSGPPTESSGGSGSHWGLSPVDKLRNAEGLIVAPTAPTTPGPALTSRELAERRMLDAAFPVKPLKGA